MPQLLKGEFTLEDLPRGFYSEKNGIKLMTPGKIQQANEAGACAFSVIVSQFIEHLTIRENDVVIMDMEAGTEHFGRGTDNISTAVVMIVDPSYESLCLTDKIAAMSESIGKKTFFLLNKTAADNESFVRQKVSKNGTILAALPLNEKIQTAGLLGKEISSGQPEISEAVDVLLHNLSVESA